MRIISINSARAFSQIRARVAPRVLHFRVLSLMYKHVALILCLIWGVRRLVGNLTVHGSLGHLILV